MKKGKDISARFEGLYLVHHNLPGASKRSVVLHEHLLFIPLQGEIRLEVSDDKFTLGPGRMLYLPPHTPHHFSSSEHQGERLIVSIHQTN